MKGRIDEQWSDWFEGLAPEQATTPQSIERPWSMLALLRPLCYTMPTILSEAQVLAKVTSCALEGLEGVIVAVEVDTL